jgi:hypothetical protein
LEEEFLFETEVVFFVAFFSANLMAAMAEVLWYGGGARPLTGGWVAGFLAKAGCTVGTVETAEAESATVEADAAASDAVMEALEVSSFRESVLT